MEANAAEGVRVTKVVAGSPAQKSGLHDGDRLLRIDGAKVSSPDEVQRIVASHAVGDVLTVIVARAGASTAAATQRTLRVALTPRPSADEQARMEHVDRPAPAWVGLEPVKTTTPKSLAALRGRVVLLDFWATWCGPCRFTAPILTRWQARYGAEGLTVVGVTTDPQEEVASFVERSGMGFGVAVDPTAATHRAYGVSALPTLFVIDKRGVVRDVMTGYDPSRESRVEALVKKLLAE